MILFISDLSLDITVQGDGYLRLLDHETIVLTRESHFEARSGILCTRAGMPLDPPIRVPETASSLSISADGVISATVAGSKVEIGMLVLARALPSGERLIGPAGSDGFGTICVGVPTTKPKVPVVLTGKTRIEIPPAVDIKSEEIVLGDLAPVEGKLGLVYIGTASLPGGSRVLTRSQIETKLRSIGLTPDKYELVMPETITVSRPAQQILGEKIVEEAFKALPVEEAVGLESTGTPTPIRVPVGDYALKTGQAVKNGLWWSVPVTISCNGKAVATLGVRFRPKYSGATKPDAMVIKPGDQLTVRIESGTLVIEVPGIARQGGAVGHAINVFLPSTNKTLRGEVIDSKSVKVKS